MAESKKDNRKQDRLFVVTSSPHVKDSESVPHIMHQVVLALLPAVLAAVYFFGFRAILVLLVSTGVSLLTEHLIQKWRGRSSTLKDGSALITGILLGLILPPGFPLWAAGLGAVVAIGMGKMVFGGLGHNIFNPALVGRAFLQAAFPVLITTWSLPVEKLTSTMVSATTQATPLAAMKFQHQLTAYADLFWGHTGGSLGETSAFAILLGGLYLVAKNYADWRIISGIFAGTISLSAILWLLAPETYANPLFHLLSGGFLLGTFFMATDMVTSPITTKGRWIFGIGIGLLIVIIRSFGGLPEGVMYSILFMNALTPLIDQYTRPAVFGSLKNSPGSVS